MEKQNAPYAVASLVLGICSLVLGCFIVGLVLGIIGLIMANNGLRELQQHPDMYTGEGMLRGGKITSIVGIVLGSLSILYYIVAVLIMGGAGLFALNLL